MGKNCIRKKLVLNEYFSYMEKTRENKSNQAHLYAFFAWAYNYVGKVIIRRFE